MDLYHCMRHIAPNSTKCLVVKGLITGVQLNNESKLEFCDACTSTKMAQKHIPMEHEGDRVKEVSSEVHTNIWGPSPIKSLGNKSYYISFTDDKTRYTKTYPLALKSNTFDAYQVKYKAWLHTQHGAVLKILL